jgi:hypothetical protein
MNNYEGCIEAKCTTEFAPKMDPGLTAKTLPQYPALDGGNLLRRI